MSTILSFYNLIIKYKDLNLECLCIFFFFFLEFQLMVSASDYNIFTTFLQDILSDRLLLVVIVEVKK